MTRDTLLLLYSGRSTTSLDLIPQRGYAGKTGRLDILIRTTRLIDADQELTGRLNLSYLLVLEGPPQPPLAVWLRSGFWSECLTGKCLEGEAMAFFRERARRGQGVKLLRKSLIEILGDEQITWNREIVLLSERGEPFSKETLQRLACRERLLIIAGGYDDPPDWVFEQQGFTKVRLTSKSYLTSHATYNFLKCLEMKVDEKTKCG